MNARADQAGRSSAIRTFLIADIRGYTRFTDQFGDEAASRLATTFAQIVAEAMEAWGGELVELRGDEALCTFESPRASLRCALELQETLSEEAAARPELPLNVGMGLDVGEAVPVGDGYRGAALNLAARLCAGAKAGEIRATQNLAHVAGPLPGVAYEPQGSEALKGIAADVAVVLVRRTTDGRPATPRVAGPTGGRSRKPLPAGLESVVPLIGRSGDLLWLQWHWRRARLGHGRVVEIVGPDGVGKTRLIVELARVAHVEGADVRLMEDEPIPSAAGSHPAVAVLEDVDRAPATSVNGLDELHSTIADVPVLVILTRRTTDGVERPRRILEPLTEADVAAIAALYANDARDAPPTRRILDESGGLPLAVHRLASQWARAAAMSRMGESARRTSRERRGLREAEEELIDRYAELEMARERSRMFAVSDEPTDGPQATAERDICPYKGLAAYEAGDAEYYFGRERLIGELVARVVGSSFVGLVGASGSGKSSALSAGLVPALASGVLPGSSEWIHVSMRPGTQPMRRFGEALRRSQTTGEADDAEPEVWLERLARRMAPAQRLLVVIDQFEEVFTADEEERERFIGLVTESRDAVKVVLAVRADQYERCAGYPRLARLLAADQVLVGPIRSDEVAAIARQPAERVGLQVEPDLVDALVADLGTEPGAMPLLSTALLELWEARERGRLTLAAYRATGGVQGAVARLAESAYARLDGLEQDAARSLFMRLVGEGTEPETIVRRRLPMSELESIDDPRVGVVVEKLTAGRLLTRDEGTVEVAHEALIREWPRLRDWIEADAQGRQVRLHLIATARTWDDRGRPEEDLYRGARLATAIEWSANHEAELNAVERDFLEASRGTAEQAAERQRRANRILRGLLAGAAGLLVLAVGAGAFALIQAGQNAENASVATVRELSLTALTLAPEDPELGLLLAAEAVQLSRDGGRTPLPQALQALWSAYVTGKSIAAVQGVGSRVVAYSPDGAELAVDAPERDDALVTIRDPATGEEIAAIPETGQTGAVVEHIAYSPDGRWIAVATSGPAGEGDGAVQVFEASTRERLHDLSTGHDGYRNISITESGLIAASGGAEGERQVDLVVWDLASGLERATITEAPGLSPIPTDRVGSQTYSGALRPGAEELIVGFVVDEALRAVSSIGIVGVSLPDGVLHCPPCPHMPPPWLEPLDALNLAPDVVAPSPSGDRIAVADIGRGRVVVVDPEVGGRIFDPIAYENPRALTWNAEGTMLAVSGNGSGVAVLEASTGLQRKIIPSRGDSILSASFRPNSDDIAVVTVTGELRIHRTAPIGGDITTAGRRAVDLAVTDEHVVASYDELGIAVYDRGSSAELHGRDFVVDARLHAQVAKDSGHVAGTYQNGLSALVEAATLRDVARLPGCTVPTGASADGRYLVIDAESRVGETCVDADVRGGVFDVSSAELVIEYGSERLHHGAVSPPAEPGGERYAAIAVYADAAGPGRVDIWELDSGTLLASVDAEDRPGFLPAFVSFSPDARYLAIGTNGPRAMVVDVAALTEGSSVADAMVFDREVHTSRAPKAILTDEGVLATTSGDGVTRFWSLDTGEMTMQLETSGLIGTGMFDFSPDFAYLYYEDGGGMIRRMPVDVDEMIDVATALSTRSLTDAECREYLRTDGCETR